MNNAFILGLDISSSAIGWCLLQGIVADRGVIRLDKKAPIGVRCVAARDAVAALLDQHAIDCLAIESPVVRFGSCIPQIRVSGCILELAERRGILTCEVTPTAAKLVLAEDGAATKLDMMMAAAPHFGYRNDALAYVKVRGDWAAIRSGADVFSEHAADALGVALAASKMVEVVQCQ